MQGAWNMMNPKEKETSRFSLIFKSYEQVLKKILNMFFTK